MADQNTLSIYSKSITLSRALLRLRSQIPFLVISCQYVSLDDYNGVSVFNFGRTIVQEIISHRYTKGDVGVRNNFNYGFGTSERLLLYGTERSMRGLTY